MTDELPPEAQMTQENEDTVEPAKASDNNADLSTEIARTVAKQPGDKVRVTRVYGNHYRANWIAPRPTPEAQMTRIKMAGVETFHVRQSRFLKATRQEDGTIEVVDMTVDKFRSN
jgi:hypothetical protein